MNDEEMQEMFENHAGSEAPTPLPEDKDIEAYSLLFETLTSQPEIPLSYNFSAKVTAVIQAKKNRTSDIWLYMSMAVGFIILLTAAYFYLNAHNSDNTSRIMMILAKYKWMLVFGIGTLLISQLLDRKLSGPLIGPQIRNN